jgi:hypothetical protein
LSPAVSPENGLRPLARAERDHVEVPGEAQRRLRIRAAGASDDAGAAVGVLVVLDLVAPLLEHRAGVAGAIALAAGRVDGVEVQQGLGEGDGVHAQILLGLCDH